MMFSDVTHSKFLEEGWTPPKPENWYCLYCIDTAPHGHGFMTEVGVKSHIASIHDPDPFSHFSNGIDYCPGSQLAVMLRRWREINAGLVSSFERSLCSIQSVEDFLYETGKKT